MRMYVHINKATNEEIVMPIDADRSAHYLFGFYHNQYEPETFGEKDEWLFQKLLDHPKVLFRHPDTDIGRFQCHRLSNYTTDIPLNTILHNIEEMENDVVVTEIYGRFTGSYMVGVVMTHNSPVIESEVRKAFIDGFLADNQ